MSIWLLIILSIIAIPFLPVTIIIIGATLKFIFELGQVGFDWLFKAKGERWR